MALETGSQITDLVTTNPVQATDLVRDSAGHLHLIKTVLRNSAASAALAGSVIDMNAGTVFTKTITGNTTLSVTNAPTTGNFASFIAELTNGGAFTVTWWSGMKWQSGTAPTLTTSGRDILAFYTIDGGTTWNGLLLGKAMA